MGQRRTERSGVLSCRFGRGPNVTEEYKDSLLLVRRDVVRLKARHDCGGVRSGLNLSLDLDPQPVLRDCFKQCVAKGKWWPECKEGLEDMECRRLGCDLATDHETKANSDVVRAHTNVELDLILITTHVVQKPVPVAPPSGTENKPVAASHVGTSGQSLPKKMQLEFWICTKVTPQLVGLVNKRLRRCPV